MVQMKVLLGKRRKSIEYLYIPHGSDERAHPFLLKHPYRDFISHMVQMKVRFQKSLGLQKKTLYPTWFR